MTLAIQYIDINELIPYVNNSRTHDAAQVTQIASSIKEFGFTNPILIDTDNSVIAGHGRLLAAQKLKMSEVPTITLSGLTATQKRAYIIADNKLSLNAGWDNDLLMLEFEALKDADYDLDLTGFSLDEIDNLSLDDDDDKNEYTAKTEVFDYEPADEKPEISNLYDTTKCDELLAEINKSGLPDNEKHLLRFGAYRHVVFNFEKIADYYANSDTEMQHHIEQSAMVVIDYNDAITGGFVALTKELQDIADDD